MNAEDARAMALDAASGHLAGTENAFASVKEVESAASDLETSDDDSTATLGVLLSSLY